MSKRTVSGITLTLLLIGMLTLAFDIQLAGARTIVVPDDYPTIQEAVYAAEAGDTILVLNGTYPENLVINNSLNLVGESPNATIIKGSITITSDNVNVSGFTVVQGRLGTGIWVSSSSGCTISNNNIKSCEDAGIYIGASSNNNIVGNTITKNHCGIELEVSNNNTITENHILRNSYFGIDILLGSSYNKITNNTISYGWAGIMIQQGFSGRCIGNVIKDNVMVNSVNIIVESCCSNTQIIRNRMTNRTATNNFGINVGRSPFLPDIPCNATIVNNTITNAKYGILIEGHYNDVFGNTVMNCEYGIYFDQSNSTTVHHNNFVNNTFQANVTDSYNISWDNGCEGNYWSDYNGTDQDWDGIGDSPYQIDESNQDNYPLMSPLGDVESPVADAGPDLTVAVGMTVTLDGSKSSDDVAIKSYVWTFTDITPQTLTGEQPKYTFNNVGDFEVTLNVSDYAGNWDTDVVTITVLPEYALTIHSSPTGVTFTVDGLSRATPWSRTYSENTSVSLVMPETHDGYVWSHWLEDGYTDRIKTVTMDRNITWTGVFVFAVQPHGPEAEFEAIPDTASTGESLKFDASASSPGWNGTHTMPISEYRWDFGDGNQTTTSTPIVHHSFSNSGIYYVTLTVYAPGATPETNATTHKVTVISVPVGGYSVPIKGYTTEKPLTLYLALIGILTVSFTIAKRRKKQQS